MSSPSSWIVTQLRARNLCARTRFFNKLFVLNLLVLLLFAAAISAQAADSDSNDEQEILRLLNQERQSRGQPPLADSEPLRKAARRHSERMADARRIGHKLAGEHDLSRRLGEEAQRFDVSGENVAVAASAARAHAALMHSPAHRANILDPDYNSVGIGVVRSGGEIYVTQDFARLVAHASVEKIEEQVAADLNRERRAAGEPGLRRVQEPELRRQACEMAAHDGLNPHAGILTGTRVRSEGSRSERPVSPTGSLAFTAIDPARIADSLRSLRSEPARAFSVGACYQSSASYENPVFWIIVVTYL